jgi:hypothetical protein
MRKTHISALTWFRFESNALGFFELLAFRVHLLRCAACTAQASRRAALSPNRRRTGFSARWVFAGTAALVIASVCAFMVLSRLMTSPVDAGDFTVKGASSFVLFNVTTKSSLAATCAPQDVLQGEVSSTTKRFITVVGVSGGAPRILYPLNGPRSEELVSGRVRLPNSWVLDDEPGTERFVAVLSDEAMKTAVVQGLVERGGSFPSGVEVIERTCVKTPR